MRTVKKTRALCVIAAVAGGFGGAQAEVIDLGGPKAARRATSSVLDFGKPRAVVRERVQAQGAREHLAPSRPALDRRHGSAQVERLISAVAQKHAPHPGLRSAGISPWNGMRCSGPILPSRAISNSRRDRMWEQSVSVSSCLQPRKLSGSIRLTQEKISKGRPATS